MTLEDKQDLDALLRRWPAVAPGKEKGVIEHEDNADWEARAEAITRAAAASEAGNAAVLAALIEPPSLPAEAGEPGHMSAGEKKMSQENESGGSTANGEPSAPVTAPPERSKPRTSLKEIAARASQAGPRAQAPTSSAATSTPLPSRPAATSTPLPRPVEAKSDDSGIINLNAVKESATPQQIAAAEKAQPGSAGLFDEEKGSAEAKPAVVIPIAAKKTRSNGRVVGLVIAVLGLAAAFAIMQTQKRHDAPVASQPTNPAATAEAKQTPLVETAAPTAVAAVGATPSAEASVEPDKGNGAKVAAGPLGGPGGPTAGASASPKEESPDDGKVAAAPKVEGPTKKSGDLKSEMERAVGADGKEKTEAATGTPEPAAGTPKNIPEQPAQGSVTTAVGAVMGGAKACVSGADDVSRANVTFSSNGSVSSVAVTGWAAAHGKAECIKAALKGAKVGPFSKPNFTVGVTIRP